VIVNVSPAVVSAMLSAVLAKIDADSINPATLTIYPAPMPSPGSVLGIGAALCVLYLADPAGSVDANVLTVTAPISAQRSGSGAATWARLSDGAGNWVMDLDVTLTGGGGAVQLDQVDGYTGGFITLTAAALML
jgi:hypothetical protein